jgi:phosphoglycerate dehydrogenase-like enzyme
MLILVPDAQYDDDAADERAVTGEAVTYAVFRERQPDRIGDEVWRGCDAMIVFHEMPIDEVVLERARRCRIIVRAGVGFDQIDLEACGRRGIPVCNVPDYGTAEVADHAIALTLGLARGLITYQSRLLADPVAGWNFRDAPLVRRLRGSRFGIVGLGRIGTATARRARALDMQVVFHDPYLPDGAEYGHGYERAWALDDLLGSCDVVSLHCPRTEETTDLLRAETLSRLKPGALVINTARGGLVDLQALADAIRDGRVAGAGIDVLPEEPPDPEHPLLQAFRRREPWIDGRLILTPHAAWFSEDGRREMREKAARTALSYLTDGTLRNCVNEAYLEGA